MSKNDEKDVFERPPTPEAPHGNVMDKAGLKPEKVRTNDVVDVFFFSRTRTHTHVFVQAYKNMEFMNSPAARHIRILCEYQHPWEVLQKENVKGTILFFGSARSKTQAQWDKEMKSATEKAKSASSLEEKARAQFQLDRLERTKWLIPWHDKVRQLSKKLTQWCLKHCPCDKEKGSSEVVVCTGGGPGMMEAANQGAYEAGPKARSIGMGISLPFEPRLNKYVRPDSLGFEFHYFFVRKYWFLYMAKALVVFPGGVGTMDELFETLTLVQTGKMEKKLPIVLFGAEFWNEVVHFEKLVEWGTISPEDVHLFKVIDTVDEAYAYITGELGEQPPVG